MSERLRPGERHFVLMERASLQMAESIMWNYTNAHQAILDLVDNAVDNRIEGKQLAISVNMDRNSFSIVNQGGEGLDQEGLQNYLQWGRSRKSDIRIGQYGVGGKAAAGFLGTGIEIRCSAAGSDEEYRLVDPNWEEKQEGTEKQHEGEILPAYTPDGYFRIKITGLKKGRNVNAKDLIEKLGNIYRPLLEKGAIHISVNKTEIKPLEIKYLRGDKNFEPEELVPQSAYGDSMLLKIGVLEEGSRLKPGIRCYYKGRLMEDGQFWGYPGPSQMPQTSRLIGEVDLDFLDVTTNKAGFVKEGSRWEETYKAMRVALARWMNKLISLQIEPKHELEKFEQDLAKEAKRILEHIAGETGIITKEMLGGQARYRLPPTQRLVDVVREGTEDIISRPRRSSEGLTPPNIRADIGPNVRRWGILFDWEPVSMGHRNTRSEIIQGERGSQFKINTDYPLYQAAKRAGKQALQLYILETAVGELGRDLCRGRSIEEYLQWVNRILEFVGEYFEHR